MSDYDELEFDPQPGPPSLAGAVTERRHRHKWGPIGENYTLKCYRCNKAYDELTSRRGKRNRSRGNSLELWFCQQLGLEKVGQMGTEVDGRTPENHAGLAQMLQEQRVNPEDADQQTAPRNGLFVAQVKSGLQFPGWMQRILDGLPRTGGRIPILGVVETPGAGHRRRALVVMTLEDFRDLHGPSDIEQRGTK